MRLLAGGDTLTLDMDFYDPHVSPNAEEWLLLDEQERIGLVRRYHEERRLESQSTKLHAATHAIVENQLAEALPPTVKALSRLMKGGLNRHEAVHAIGFVVIEHLKRLSKEPKPEGDLHEMYLDAVDALTVQSWRARMRD